MTSRYARLSRDQLATLVPELLLIGQMIDRSGMAWCIKNFGRERCCRSPSRSGWAPARSTRSVCRRLEFEGDDVITIFKGCNWMSAPLRSSWISVTPCTTDGTASSTSTTAVRCLMPSRWARTSSAVCATTSRTPPLMPRRWRPIRSADTPDPPPAAGTRRPAPALRVDRHHRRVVSTVIADFPALDILRKPAPPQPNSIRSTPPTKGSPTTRESFSPMSTSARSRIPRWCASPTKCACRCTCSTCRSRSRCASVPPMRIRPAKSAPSS